MAKPRSADYDKSLALLRAALGDFDAKKPLSKILKAVPDFGKFEWMLTIIGLEIDLRVDIPESLADDLARTPEAFAQLVAALPKVDSAGYTLECLGLVAQALLSLDAAVEPSQTSQPAAARKARARKPSKAAAKPKSKAAAKPKSKAAAKPKSKAAAKPKSKAAAKPKSKAAAKPKSKAAAKPKSKVAAKR